MAEMKLRWIDSFVGMSQRQPMDRIPSNSSPLLVNVSVQKPGAWIKRPGSALLGTTQAGNGVFGLVEYTPNGSAPVLRAVRSADLDKYNIDTDDYTELDSAQFTASTDVQAENFKNRVYYISASDNLCYESGSTCTDVGSGTNEISGSTLAVAQNTLFVGGVTSINDTPTSYEDRVYYSLFDAANNTPSDQLYEDDETMATSTRWFTVNSPVVRCFTFGTTGQVCVFTSKDCWTFDMKLENNAIGPQKIFDIGLANVNAVTYSNGYMIWMDPGARIWAWAGAGPPVNISWELEDEAHGQAILSKLASAAPTQIASVAVGSVGNVFQFSLGNITYLSETISNAVLEGFMSSGGKYIYWTLYSYPVKPARYALMTKNGVQRLVFGADGVDDIYEISTGTNDGATAIDAKARTKFFDMDEPIKLKEAVGLYVKYRPQSVDNTNLKISYAIDGKFSYTAISDPDNGTPVTAYGVVDMYESDSATRLDQVKVVQFPGGVRFRSISIEVANASASEGFEITGLGIVYKVIGPDIRPEVT